MQHSFTSERFGRMCLIAHLKLWLCVILSPLHLGWIQTATCVTVESSSGPPDCDFEDVNNLCGYTANDDSGLLWKWGSVHITYKGQTVAEYMEHPVVPTSNYLYTISNSDGDAYHKYAKVVSPAFEVTGESCLYFDWFSNYCNDNYFPGIKIFLRKYPDSGENDLELRSIPCIRKFKRNTRWNTEAVHLPKGKYKLVLAGLHYRSAYRAIALDDIRVRDGSCSRGIVASKVKPGDCSFEDLTQCGYTYAEDSEFPMYRVFKEQQERGTNSEAPLGYYMVIDYSIRYKYSNAYGKASRLQTPVLHIRSGCLSFSYFNSVLQNDQSLNALDVYKNDGTKDSLLVRIPKKYGTQWRKEYVTLPPGRYRVIFQAKMSRAFGANDLVGIDNVEFFEEDCQTVRNKAPTCQTGKPEELCRNGGSCKSFGKKTFTCTCPQGYYGRQCQHELPCLDSPCHNNGKCRDLGHSNYSCTCNPSFSGERCEHVINCGNPSNTLQHAVLKDVSKVTYNGVAKFECIHGYKMTGSGRAVCSTQEKWQTNSQCVYIDCGEAPEIQNAMKVDVSNTSLDGKATYRCSPGHVMTKGTGSLTCKLKDRQESWQDENGTPFSQAIKCDANCGSVDDFIQNAQLTNVDRTTSGGQAIFLCERGFLMHSVANGRMCGEAAGNKCPVGAECTVNGTWVARVRCSAIDCSTPPKMTNAQAQFSSTGYKATARYTCNPGSKSVGRDGIAVCGDNGYWSDSLTGKNILSTATSSKEAIIKCLKDCGDPAKEAGNFTVIKIKGTTEGSSAEVGCKTGFIAITSNGDVSRTGTLHAFCRNDGEWKVYGSCLLVDCKTPPNVTNALVKTVTNTTLGGEATYVCNVGYKFLPASKSKLKCQVNRYHRNGKEGRWRSESSWNERPEDTIRCVEIPNCNDPPLVENGHVLRVTNTSLYGRATYQCSPGYVKQSDVDTAVCWPYVSSGIEYATWALVPTCRRQCAIKNGAGGPQPSIKVNLTSCTSRSFAHFHAKEDCSKPTMHVVYRDRPHVEGSSMKFYGSDLCVAQSYTRMNKYNDKEISTKEECKTFCLDHMNNFHRALIHEDLQYWGPPGYSQRKVNIRKTFIKYRVIYTAK